MNVNMVILVGNITKDPELKKIPSSGQSVCSFSLATNETFTSNGQKIKKTEFHNITAWGKLAENIAKYMRKGSSIFVEGKLQTRNWEKEGVKHYRTEIVALNVRFGAKRGEGGSEDGAYTLEDYQKSQGEGAQPQETQSLKGEDIRLEDIPF